MNQESLPFEPHKLHRKDDPITSWQSAERAGELRVKHHQIILGALALRPAGLTSQEIANLVGLEHAAVWRRMGELRNAHLVIQTDETRPNKSGRLASVWKLA